MLFRKKQMKNSVVPSGFRGKKFFGDFSQSSFSGVMEEEIMGGEEIEETST